MSQSRFGKPTSKSSQPPEISFLLGNMICVGLPKGFVTAESLLTADSMAVLCGS